MPSSTVPDVDHSESTPGHRAPPDTASVSLGSEPAAAGAVRTDQHTAEDAQDRWRRAAADLENTRKRAARELSRVRERERADVAT